MKKYKIADKYLNTVIRYAMNTKLNIRGVYTKEEWNKSGFKDSILEEVIQYSLQCPCMLRFNAIIHNVIKKGR